MEELKNRNKIEISVKKQVQIEKELIGKIIPHRNHILFEINNETGEISEATYLPVPTFVKFGEKVEKPKKQALVRDGFSYVSAMNKKNALKKYFKGSNGGKELGFGLDIKTF
jgi:hypothetical protein